MKSKQGWKIRKLRELCCAFVTGIFFESLFEYFFKAGHFQFSINLWNKTDVLFLFQLNFIFSYKEKCQLGSLYILHKFSDFTFESLKIGLALLHPGIYRVQRGKSSELRFLGNWRKWKFVHWPIYFAHHDAPPSSKFLQLRRKCNCLRKKTNESALRIILWLSGRLTR